MNKLIAALIAVAASLPGIAQAALDETLRIKETIEINAPADKVWARIGSFGDMAWHPAIAKAAITSGNANDIGATRELTLQDGGTIKEVLVNHDAAGMMMKYEITESVLPVRDYVATLRVTADGSKSVVSWISIFKRKDPSASAPAGQDDKAAKEAVDGIFKAGLANLKKISE